MPGWKLVVSWSGDRQDLEEPVQVHRLAGVDEPREPQHDLDHRQELGRREAEGERAAPEPDEHWPYRSRVGCEQHSVDGDDEHRLGERVDAARVDHHGDTRAAEHHVAQARLAPRRVGRGRAVVEVECPRRPLVREVPGVSLRDLRSVQRPFRANTTTASARAAGLREKRPAKSHAPMAEISALPQTSMRMGERQRRVEVRREPGRHRPS